MFGILLEHVFSPLVLLYSVGANIFKFVTDSLLVCNGKEC